MVLLSVLETKAETKLKAGLSNHRALMMEMEDKLGGGSSGTLLLLANTSPSESRGAI